MLKYNNINAVMTIITPTIYNMMCFSKKNIKDISPIPTVAIICAKPPTMVSMAALSLSPFSNMKIRPRKFPILLGKNIPAEMPVKMDKNDFHRLIFSTGLS